MTPHIFAVLIICALTVAMMATSLRPADYAALRDLYEGTDGDHWDLDSWETTVPWEFSDDANPCTDSWYGFECIYAVDEDVYRVSGIALSFVNMEGTLPASLRNLTALNYLFLDDNYIYGNVPTQQAWPTSRTWLSISTSYLGLFPI
jgi:hypothetical protein